MRRYIILSIVLLTITGCFGKPMVRIANRSDIELTNVVVKLPSQTENYGRIPPGETTEYREVAKAYRYAYIEATLGGEMAVLQPIDYVGEELLGREKYTYGLRYNSKAES